MLGKLIKHEFKAVSKILVILHIALFIITVIGMFAINFRSENGRLQIISQLTFIMYILILIAVSVAVLIFIIVRFYRNLFTDEGYLMNTLPVKSHELILSKLIVGFLWCMINGICTIISVFLLWLSQSSFDEIIKLWNELYTELVNDGILVSHFTIFILIGCIISVLYMIIMFYASIAIGQTFRKHKVLFSLGAYVVLYVISQIVSTLILLPFGFVTMLNTDTPNFETTFNSLMLLSLAASLLLAIAYFVITNYILNKKLNLE